MTTSEIRIRGARTHNLADLDIDVPRGRLVVFAGVSGSGKSSLVFDTIAAEAGYQLNETFPPFVRNRLPKWSRPPVREINGVSTVIVVDQRRIGGNARSTLGTITDTWTYLRLLYSRLGTPHIGDSNRFSFNDPAGMCLTCSGIGETIVTAVDRFLDESKSLIDGAVLIPGYGRDGAWHRLYAADGPFDVDVPISKWTDQQRHALLYGADGFEGIVQRFERIHLHTSDSLSERKRHVVDRFTESGPCPDCDGERLNAEARGVQVCDRRLPELAGIEITDLITWAEHVPAGDAAPVQDALLARLRALEDIGLGYLHLGRATSTLSGGESQRVKTVRHLASSLTETLYVFDEPTVGLHPIDVDSMIGLLQQLRDRGNSVLVVEHDPAVMAAADHVVEIGPGAGRDGGRVVFQGTFRELVRARTATGRALRDADVSRAVRTPTSWVTVRDARRNNLRKLTVDIPESVMTVLTGVAGSGKSSLAAEFAAQHDASVIDQRPVSANRRSTPLSYTGIAGAIRTMFAKTSGRPPGTFSANSEGACPECRGLGVRHLDLAFMDAEETVCETCQGRRFADSVLQYRVDGLSIADIDDLTVGEAIARLPAPRVARALTGLASVGLGYLRLGQSLSTLSGGEAQRVKIARELATADARARRYVFDEPTTGLHPRDIGTLVEVLDTLVDRGDTVLVIEHNVEVIGLADWVIDLGPGAGRHGGRVLYSGTVAGLGDTPTGRALTRGTLGAGGPSGHDRVCGVV